MGLWAGTRTLDQVGEVLRALTRGLDTLTKGLDNLNTFTRPDMAADLNNCQDHKKNCGSYSTVIVLCVERDWIQVRPLGSVDCFDCEPTFTSKITLYCHSKSNYPHP